MTDQALSINLSQQPDLLQLQKRCYQMLHVDNEKMPSKADTVGAQVVELKKLCVKRTLIIILDDICKSKKYLAYRRSYLLTSRG